MPNRMTGRHLPRWPLCSPLKRPIRRVSTACTCTADTASPRSTTSSFITGGPRHGRWRSPIPDTSFSSSPTDGSVPLSRKVTEQMDFTEPANWSRIRGDAEAFIARHVTPEVIENERRTGDGVDRSLTRKLGERGWVAPTWSVEEGGAGLDPFEAAVLLDTLRKGGVPTIGPGTTMLPANAIKATGSDELKARILPGVTAGETLICLGYTEPAGGSDVFACATRSEQDGNEWIVNGQKIFTTFAHMADYCFLLTRSQAGSAGTRGLTMLLVPLDSPGIEIRAVHTIGYERTNVVFYNDVRVADANRIGEAHQGFSVMRAALEAEQNIAPSARTRTIAADALEFARTDRKSTRLNSSHVAI